MLVITNDPGEVAQALAKFELDWIGNKQDSAWQIAPTHPPIAVTPSVVTPEAEAAVLQDAVPHVAEGAPV